MMGRMRKYISTILVALLTAGVVAAITGGGPAIAFHTNHKAFYRRNAVTVGAGLEGAVTASCPTGKKAIGGGGYTSGSSFFLEASFPSSKTSTTQTGFKAWTVWGTNTSGATQTLTAYVICAVAGKNSSYPGGVSANG